MNRILTVLAVVVLLLSGCAVDRESDDVLAVDEAAAADPSDASDASEGGDDASGSEESGDTVAPTTTTTIAPFVPPTTGAPDDIALSVDFGDSTWEITHGELNAIVVPTQENESFVDLVFRGTPPPEFTLTVLTENLFSQAVQAELAATGGEVTQADLDVSAESLIGQVEGLLATTADPATEAQALYDTTPYLPFLVRYQASQDALTALLAETADPADGVPCVSHILLTNEADAQVVLNRVESGEEFASVAVETSTGPSGPNGGDLGCAPSSQYVAPFAEAVDAAEIGEFVGPVETEFGFHVLVVNRTEVDGRTIATERLQERVSNATVVVDEKLGTWDPDRLAITPAES